MTLGMERLPDLDGIQSFLLVAENLSFRRAAERMNLDRSVLSRRIKDLETCLGVMLLQRTTREVQLTDAGQAFYERNLDLLHALQDSMSLARRTAAGMSGRLRVGYMAFAALATMPGSVRDFRAAYPDVSIELLYFRTQAQKIELSRRSLDVGFMIGPFTHTDFHAATVLEEHLIALVPSSHPLAAKEQLLLSDLSGIPLVMGTMAQWDFYRKILQTLFDERGLKLHAAYEASSTMGILGLVAAGLGPTLYPAGIGRLQPQGTCVIPIVDCDTQMQTVLAWRRDDRSAATRNFIQVCGVV